MDYQKRYREWLENDYFDADTKAELTAIKENDNEIKERFYKDLEFGTAGLRGVIGAGTNRMNIYTVRKATQGLDKLYSEEWGTKQRSCDCIRFQTNVTGICGRVGALPCSKWD